MAQIICSNCGNLEAKCDGVSINEAVCDSCGQASFEQYVPSLEQANENFYSKDLSETGYSYSGISDIIHNRPEHAKGLILEINRQYLEVKEKMNLLEKELFEASFKRGLLVSSFMHAHSSLGLGKQPLCFVFDNNAVVVEIKEDNKINYESYPLSLTA